MNKISAVIIAKNEQNMIEDAIESVLFCDEIIVIDNNSKDDTFTLSQKLGAKVYETDANDFSELRNLGLEKAESDWILYLDADERIDETLQKEIKKALSSKEFSSYFLKRKNYYLGKNEWPYVEKILRLFKKNDLESWIGEIHESPRVKGRTGILDGFILHFTHRDLESMVTKTASWSTIEASIRLKNQHPQMIWWRFPRVMLTAFIKSYILQGGYKAKTVGLIESIYQAFSIFITYAKLWEMQNKIKNQKSRLPKSSTGGQAKVKTPA